MEPSELRFRCTYPGCKEYRKTFSMSTIMEHMVALHVNGKEYLYDWACTCGTSFLIKPFAVSHLCGYERDSKAVDHQVYQITFAEPDLPMNKQLKEACWKFTNDLLKYYVKVAYNPDGYRERRSRSRSRHRGDRDQRWQGEERHGRSRVDQHQDYNQPAPHINRRIVTPQGSPESYRNSPSHPRSSNEVKTPRYGSPARSPSRSPARSPSEGTVNLDSDGLDDEPQIIHEQNANRNGPGFTGTNFYGGGNERSGNRNNNYRGQNQYNGRQDFNQEGHQNFERNRNFKRNRDNRGHLNDGRRSRSRSRGPSVFQDGRQARRGGQGHQRQEYPNNGNNNNSNTGFYFQYQPNSTNSNDHRGRPNSNKNNRNHPPTDLANENPGAGNNPNPSNDRNKSPDIVEVPLPPDIPLSTE